MRVGLDVTVLHDFQKTGVGVYTFNLVSSLLQINKNDQFILFGVGNLSSFKHLKSLPFLRNKNVQVKLFKLPSKLFKTSFNLWQRLELPTINKVIGEIDIFHSFNYFLPPQGKGYVVATVYDLTPITHPHWHQPKTVQMEKLRLDRIDKYADLVIAISASTKRDFLKLYPRKRVEVIYPGVGEQFTKIITDNQIKKILDRYNLEPGYFLSVATKEPRKNLETLVKAYMQGNFKQPLVLVGKIGWGKDNLSSLIKDNSKIKVLGFVEDEDLPALYNQSLCLVYPSFYEGFGIPLLEAMYSKTAVITSNSSSLPEVVGDSALLINPNSVDDLKDAMLKISSDKSLRRVLINKGIIRSKQFSWDKSAQKLLKLYHEFS